MALRLIICDVDGCVGPEESAAWDFERFARLAWAIRSANAGNSPPPPLTLCTGRPQPYVECLMKLLDVRLPAICENGAVFYTLADNRARLARSVDEAAIDPFAGAVLRDSIRRRQLYRSEPRRSLFPSLFWSMYRNRPMRVP